MDERIVPADAVAGRKTPSFTPETVPAALLAAHHTTVWGELIVEEGVVTFVEEDPAWQHRLEAPAVQAIVPHRRHHVEPELNAVFHIQFYESAEASPPGP